MKRCGRQGTCDREQGPPQDQGVLPGDSGQGGPRACQVGCGSLEAPAPWLPLLGSSRRSREPRVY